MIGGAQNISEQHRMDCQRDVYLNKNPEDSNLNENEVQEILKDDGMYN